MYVIETGKIELSRAAVVLTQLSAGAAFGEDSLVGQQHDGAQISGDNLVTNLLVGSNTKRERTAMAVKVRAIKSYGCVVLLTISSDRCMRVCACVWCIRQLRRSQTWL